MDSTTISERDARRRSARGGRYHSRTFEVLGGAPVRREDEQRATFRVAVKPKSGVEAALRFAGRAWRASVRDLSSEGVFLTLDQEVPALTPGTAVEVDISFEGNTTRLHGIVRAHRAGGYGVFFPERAPDGQPNPRERLARISAHLQRGDLSQRLKVLKLPE